MRKLLYLFFIVLFFANCEKPSDCIESSGPIATLDFTNLSFNRIIVNKGIALVITQGDVFKVQVRTGTNMMSNIEVRVIDNTLILEDKTTCNWVRDYGQTTVLVSAPNITDIYCKTEKSISSNGVLKFPNLHLVSMDNFDGFKGVGTGDFILDLDCENLYVENNDVSRYFISGKTNQLRVSFYEYGGIFQGENILANTVFFYHRGSNDITVHPVKSIKGDIYSVGNIICTSRPSTVEVVEHYRGKLIFK